ncbi:PREDICTED: protein FANTASTIC FOUR 1-like [Nicotiana attenuata]|uniref:protein FANTASTIC FOUR 1-like n=1 Tax=Nicotiana attenuata TaxID=49451 RepID=UPI000904E843|nr:PREDICTED: protein FANTASTIC FOUR 1-like [Nicotiana attenuata]
MPHLILTLVRSTYPNPTRLKHTQINNPTQTLHTKSPSLRSSSPRCKRCWQRSNSEKKEKKFTPPLSSLNQNGKPNFFMRAVRKDGRLELTEVKIGRPETLLASGQDGRLKLHIRDEEEETEEENEDFPLDDEKEMIVTIQENDEEILEEEEEEEEEDKVAEWKFPATSGGSGDVVRRNSHV